jgi:pimeloyl-ACP methyl ester carboxylesterase
MAADLLGTSFNAPENLKWGESVQISGTVKNVGNSSARYSYAKVFLSDNRTISNSDHFLGYQYVSSLNSGAQYSFSRSVTLPSTPPSRFTASDSVYVGMIVDGYSYVSESNEFNNRNRGNGYDRDQVSITSSSASKPDLIAEAFNSDENLKWGQSFDVSFRVKNIGNASAGSSWARIMLSSNDNIESSDRNLGWVKVNSLAPGQSRSFTRSLTLPSSPPSGFTSNDSVNIGIRVDDYRNYVSESNEGNNSNRGLGKDRDAVTVSAANAKPDLVGSYFKVQDTGQWGQTLNTSGTISNNGGSDSGNFYVQYFLSSNDNITSGDYYLGSKQVSSIAAGSTRDVSTSLQLPSKLPEGFTARDDAYIAMYVDRNSNVSESNENNNRNRGLGLDTEEIRLNPGRTISHNLEWKGANPNGHRSNINVRLDRATYGNDAPNISSDVATWVVIHGRADNRHSFTSLAEAIDGYTTGDQVLTLDWSQGAADNTDWKRLNGADWIPQVATWANGQLDSLGIKSANLVGHSWGSYLAYEIADRTSYGNDRIIALDPAKTATGSYDGSSVNFKSVTTNSWAFFGGGFYGSANLSSTADVAIKLEYQDPKYSSLYTYQPGNGMQHSAPKLVFESLVNRNLKWWNAPSRASTFSMSNFTASSPRYPWSFNQYNGIFEGVIRIDNVDRDGQWGESFSELSKLGYVKNGTQFWI